MEHSSFSKVNNTKTDNEVMQQRNKIYIYITANKMTKIEIIKYVTRHDILLFLSTHSHCMAMKYFTRQQMHLQETYNHICLTMKI